MSLICFTISGICFLCFLFALNIKNSWGISFFLIWTLIALVVGLFFRGAEEREVQQKIQASEAKLRAIDAQRQKEREQIEEKRQRQASLNAYITEHITAYSELLHKYFTPMCPVGVTRLYENNIESERFFITVWEDETLVLLTEEMAVLDQLRHHFSLNNNTPCNFYRLFLIPFDQIEFIVSSQDLSRELKNGAFSPRTLIRWYDITTEGQTEYHTLEFSPLTDDSQYFSDKRAALDFKKVYPNSPWMHGPTVSQHTPRYNDYYPLDASLLSIKNWHMNLFYRNSRLYNLDLGRLFIEESLKHSRLWEKTVDHANQKDHFDLCVDYLEKLRCFSDLDWFHPESIDGLIRRVRRDQKNHKSEYPHRFSELSPKKYFYQS